MLGTLDPRIPALGGWEPVAELSNGYAEAADMFIDLSAESWAGEPVYQAATELAYTLDDLDETDLANMANDEIAAFLTGGYAALFEMANGGGTDDDTTNGLTARGQSIYRKLTAKGVSAKVAMAMARRAQNVKPGAQLANPDMTGPDAAITLAYQQTAQRQSEDAARPMRRRGGTSVTDDRLAYALGRISRGTYMPTQPQRALGFARPGRGLRGSGHPGGLQHVHVRRTG